MVAVVCNHSCGRAPLPQAWISLRYMTAGRESFHPRPSLTRAISQHAVGGRHGDQTKAAATNRLLVSDLSREPVAMGVGERGEHALVYYV